MPFGFSGQPLQPTAQRMQQSRGGAPGSFRDQRTQVGYEVNKLRGQLPKRNERENRINDLYDQSLADPIATAGKFEKGFGDAAAAWAAPQQREFANTITGVAGNVAARFGGNASSEEQRQVGKASDDFTRNLSEQIAQLAPQAFQAGQQYTDALGGASRDANERSDRIRQMILEGVLGIHDKQKTNVFGQALGAAGAVAGAVL